MSAECARKICGLCRGFNANETSANRLIPVTFPHKRLAAM